MTVRSFIQMLLEECDNLDQLVVIYVCAQVKDMIPRIEDADGHPDHWYIYDNLDIEEIECDGKYCHIHVNKSEY